MTSDVFQSSALCINTPVLNTFIIILSYEMKAR